MQPYADLAQKLETINVKTRELMKLRLSRNIPARTLSMELLKLDLKLISVSKPTNTPKKTDWKQAFLVF